MAEIAILNCGEGDTKLSFDKDDPAEMLRAKCTITDEVIEGAEAIKYRG